MRVTTHSLTTDSFLNSDTHFQLLVSVSQGWMIVNRKIRIIWKEAVEAVLEYFMIISRFLLRLKKNSQGTCYNSVPLGQELNPDLYKINQQHRILTLEFQ